MTAKEKMPETEEKPPPKRRSFILVLWEESGGFLRSSPVWRISLQDARTLERYGFKNLAELVRYLNQWMEEIEM